MFNKNWYNMDKFAFVNEEKLKKQMKNGKYK